MNDTVNNTDTDLSSSEDSQDILTNPAGKPLSPTNLGVANQSSSIPVDEWYLTSDIKGEGEKPEWFNDKTFKTVIDQAKSAVELRKALGERTAAPEEYKVEVGDEYKDFSLDENDPLLTFWKDFSKKSKMSQEQFNQGIKGWFDYIKNIQDERANNFKTALEKMGANGEQELTNIENWFNNNFPDHKFENFKLLLQTPEDLKLVQEMRSKMNNNSPINTQDVNTTEVRDRDYWRQQMSKENGYGIDIYKTQRIDSEFKKFIESGGKVR